jgi:hypothetical protein
MECCKVCKYYRPYNLVEGPFHGQCCRFPPSVKKKNYIGDFPNIAEANWCGEFELKITKETGIRKPNIYGTTGTSGAIIETDRGTYTLVNVNGRYNMKPVD